MELCWKHTSTISQIAHSETHKTLVSCSIEGEVVVWEYLHKFRLEFKNRTLLHCGEVTHCAIDDEMRVYVTGGEDGLVNIVDLFNHSLLRTLKFPEPIRWVLTVVFPLYLVVIGGEEWQKCFSLNGQLLEKSRLKITEPPMVFKYSHFKDRVLAKVGTELLFLKMPSFSVFYRYEIRKGDEGCRHFVMENNCMLYTLPNSVVCARGCDMVG